MARGYPAVALTRTQLLRSMRHGTYGFDEFAGAMMPWLRRDALYLLRKWRGPLAVGVEDLQQEMLLTAWMVIGDYDESRGVSIDVFVRYCMIDKAKKWLHRQRNAKRRSDSAPSRLERTFTELGVETQHDLETIEPVDKLTPEEAVERREQFERATSMLLSIAQAFPRKERRAAEVVIACGGDLAAAREQILGSPRLMLDLRVTETMVAGVVTKAARALEFEVDATQGAV